MSSFARVTKIVERREAVWLCPNTDFARVLKRVVIPFDRFPSIERDGEMITLETHPQRVPRAGSDLHIRAFLLGTLAFDGVVNRHVVFESVRARNVVIVRVLQAPDNAARLVFLACNRFEFHVDKAVFDARAVLETNRESRLPRLLQHVRFAWSGI